MKLFRISFSKLLIFKTFKQRNMNKIFDDLRKMISIIWSLGQSLLYLPTWISETS